MISAEEMAKKLIVENRELKDCLKDLYEKYVVDLHGPNTCDCDPSVGIDGCAPCTARSLLDRRD
jgi:hypothetical protein